MAEITTATATTGTGTRYWLWYFHEIARGEHTVRLEILKKGNIAPSSALYIGGLQSLGLEVQGGQNEAETAIIKTALHFSIVDCYDKPDGSTTIGGRQYPVKYGSWEGFYTPDATLWRVRLKYDGTIIWTGYITPDSWAEDLTYHSTLSITARDNIGHLEDMDFDMAGTDGMVTASEIITGALSRIGMTMTATQESALKIYTADGTEQSALAACFAVEAFDGETWYQALEDILDSLGLVLRYVGDNAVEVMTVREWSATSGRTSKTVVFADNSGHRDLAPAYRQIVEKFSPDAGDDIAHNYQRESDYTAYSSATFGSCYAPSASSVWTRYGDIGMINPYALTNPSWRNSFNPDRQTALLVGAFQSLTPTSGSPRIVRTIQLTGSQVNGQLVITMGALPVAVATDYEYMNLVRPDSDKSVTMKMLFAIEGYRGTSWRYYDPETGSFSSSSHKYMTVTGTYGQQSSTMQRSGTTSVDYTVEANFAEIEKINIIIYGFTLTTTDTTIAQAVAAGYLYGYISQCTLSQSDTDYPSRTITTVYNDALNTQLKRTPAFGEITFNVMNANSVKNGIYYLSDDGAYLPANMWKWDGVTMNAKSLPVLIHQQILAFHSKANNVLSGTVIDWTEDSPTVNALYMYGGRQHLLVGGTINYLTGRIDSAVLREFVDYSDLWVDGTQYAVYLDALGSSEADVVAAITSGTGMSAAEATAIAESTLPALVYTYDGEAGADSLVTSLTEAGATAHKTTVTA